MLKPDSNALFFSNPPGAREADAPEAEGGWISLQVASQKTVIRMDKSWIRQTLGRTKPGSIQFWKSDE
jgi:hypothetical protein